MGFLLCTLGVTVCVRGSVSGVCEVASVNARYCGDAQANLHANPNPNIALTLTLILKPRTER